MNKKSKAAQSPLASLLSVVPSFHNEDAAQLMLRIGLAIVFVYAGYSAFKTPDAWVDFIPHFTTKYVAAKTSLDIVSVIQFLVAIVLVTGKYVKYVALVSFLLIFGILIFNLNTLLVTFRDFGLAFMALALFFLDKD